MEAMGPLGFSIALGKNSGYLVLDRPLPLGAGALEALELEIPGLRFPCTLSGGSRAFRNRRCRLHSARIVLGASEAADWLAVSRADDGLGLGDWTVQFDRGRIRATGTLKQSARFTVEASLALERGARLVLSLEALSTGSEALSPSQLGLALLTRLGAPARFLKLDGPTRLLCDPLRMALFRALPTSGWRLPDVEAAALRSLRIDQGSVTLVYGHAPS